MRNLSVRHPPSGSVAGSSSVLSRHGSTAATRRVTLVFNNLQPAELAEQLTFLEYKAFRRITVRPTRSFVSQFRVPPTTMSIVRFDIAEDRKQMNCAVRGARRRVT